mgnify:CR=1 FL=1
MSKVTKIRNYSYTRNVGINNIFGVSKMTLINILGDISKSTIVELKWA